MTALPDLLREAAQAGAHGAGYTVLRLPWAVAPLFEQWLDRHAPGSKEKVLGRIREMRGGKLYDAKFGARMKGEGIFAEQIKTLHAVARKRSGFTDKPYSPLSTASFRVPSAQLTLF